MIKFIGKLKCAWALIKKADEAGVYDEILKAVSDRKVTVNEAISIVSRICRVMGIDFDTTGIKL